MPRAKPVCAYIYVGLLACTLVGGISWWMRPVSFRFFWVRFCLRRLVELVVRLVDTRPRSGEKRFTHGLFACLDACAQEDVLCRRCGNPIRVTRSAASGLQHAASSVSTVICWFAHAASASGLHRLLFGASISALACRSMCTIWTLVLALILASSRSFRFSTLLPFVAASRGVVVEKSVAWTQFGLSGWLRSCSSLVGVGLRAAVMSRAVS